jgi:arylsulfatase A-like enzyme
VTLPADAGEDSFSILPWLRGRKPARPTHDAVVHHSINGLFAVRRGSWKFVDGQGSGGWSKDGTGPDPGQLYDLSTDPAERENLYAKRADVVKELRALLERYRTEGRSRSTR